MNIRQALKNIDFIQAVNNSLARWPKFQIFERKTPNLLLLIGAIVGIVVIVNLLSAITHEDDTSRIPVLITGHTYLLKNPNSGPILLSPAPSISGTASYKGIETDDNGCLVMPGTLVLLEEQTINNYIHYAKVKPVQGKCKDRKGWTAVVNLQSDQLVSKIR